MNWPYQGANPITIISDIINTYLDRRRYKAFLFGSRAHKKHTEYSDYDIGILGKQKIPLSKMLQIQRTLDETPYNVDLVDFLTVDEQFKTFTMKKTILL